MAHAASRQSLGKITTAAVLASPIWLSVPFPYVASPSRGGVAASLFRAGGRDEQHQRTPEATKITRRVEGLAPSTESLRLGRRRQPLLRGAGRQASAGTR